MRAHKQKKTVCVGTNKKYTQAQKNAQGIKIITQKDFRITIIYKCLML